MFPALGWASIELDLAARINAESEPGARDSVDTMIDVSCTIAENAVNTVIGIDSWHPGTICWERTREVP